MRRMCADAETKKNTACAILAVTRAHRYPRRRTTKLLAAAVLYASRGEGKRNDDYETSVLFIFFFL